MFVRPIKATSNGKIRGIYIYVHGSAVIIICFMPAYDVCGCVCVCVLCDMFEYEHLSRLAILASANSTKPHNIYAYMERKCVCVFAYVFNVNGILVCFVGASCSRRAHKQVKPRYISQINYDAGHDCVSTTTTTSAALEFFTLKKRRASLARGPN